MSDDDCYNLERRLDRDFEREGGYRSPRPRAQLTGRGTLRTAVEGAGVLQPTVPIKPQPTKGGGK